MDDARNQIRQDSIRGQIKAFPTGPGLYFIKDDRDTVLYIGKAKNLRSRISSYFQPGADLMESRGPKIVDMVAQAGPPPTTTGLTESTPPLVIPETD